MKRFYDRHPLLVILSAAFLLRTAAAFYNYTPTAEDDYANVIEPALNFYQTGTAITTELYRLPLLPKTFYLFIAPLKIFSVTDTTFLVSWGLFCLGLLSLAGVWAFYKLGEQIAPGAGKTAGWLYAGHFILPFFSTRAFQESLTLTTVPLGLYFLRHAQAKAGLFLIAGLFTGLTVIFRFQAAILALIIAGYLVWQVLQKKNSRSQLAAFIAGGLAALLLLALLDVAEGRTALSTPLEYVRINFLGNIAGENYGSAPWHTYLTLLTVIFIPPFSFVLLYPFFRSLRKDALSVTCLFVFVVSHSLIGNKLERFMLPVLPFFFLLTLRGVHDFSQLKLVRFSWLAFVFLNLVILAPVTLSRSQLNTIDAARYLTGSPRPLKLYHIDLWKQAYMTFAKPVPANYQEISALAESLRRERQNETDVLSLGELAPAAQSSLRAAGFTCIEQRKFAPSWQERIVIVLNPRFNARRDTSVLYLCKRIP